MADNVVELRNVKKIFPGVTALNNIHIELKKGEVHGLIGENGAGKSTLIKVLTGVYQPDEGSILVDGEEVQFLNPLDAKKKGIACVYQELNTMYLLSVTDNMFMGNFMRRKSGLLDYEAMRARVTEVLESMGQHIDPNIECGKLSVGQQQMVEIGKAVMQDTKVLILDEPTSSLSESETLALFDTVKILKEKGIAVLFVSHKLEEIFTLCDTVTVMRDSKHIATEPIGDMTKESLISHMVGRKITNLYPKVDSVVGDVVLEVKNLTRVGNFKNISFLARRGEILGFAGLVGAGRSELFRAIFGADELDEGEIYVNDKKCDIKEPRDAIAHSMAFLTEDRKTEGLFLKDGIDKNLCILKYKDLMGKVFIDQQRIKLFVNEMIERLKINTTSGEKVVNELSGGNQQKVVVGKWMATDADIYIFDEPTRGIDVGAKVEIYNILNELVLQGKSVIVISSELPEIMGICDRIIVMHEGKITAEIDRKTDMFEQEAIMRAMQL